MKNFYRLTQQEFVRVNELLKDSELRVWLWISTVIPFEDSSAEIDTAVIAEQLGLSRRTVQRALKRLEELELFDVEITRAKIKRFQPQAVTTPNAPKPPVLRNSEPLEASDPGVAKWRDMSPSGVICRQSDPGVAKERDMSSQWRDMSPTVAETHSQQGFQTLQTIQTYTDYLDSLSDSERENFEEFCLEAVRALPTRPTLTRKWIEKHWPTLAEDFKAKRGNSSPTILRREEKIEQLRSVWMRNFQGDRDWVRSQVSKNPEWRIAVGEEGVYALP